MKKRRNQLLKCWIVFLIIYFVSRCMLFGPLFANGQGLAHDKYVQLACIPNDAEEHVEGYRIYYRSGHSQWSTDRFVSFYGEGHEKEPKYIWGWDKDEQKKILIFQLTPELAPLQTDTIYQFYATAFRDEEESDPSPKRPYWLSPSLIEWLKFQIAKIK